jgi:hypothetical protein
MVSEKPSKAVPDRPLLEIVVGFTGQRRVAAKRRGVVLGKTTLIY